MLIIFLFLFHFLFFFISFFFFSLHFSKKKKKMIRRFFATTIRSRQPTCEALVIGDEILNGKTLDSNSNFLAK